ncbi:unnamed protein product [Ceratitis capitata]|uniref:(Mediterranean fruit fly) hypothetical protein n=1 Tax=Ceratitis capitata TaxID=7213 RepID=A0A811U172_CERCA|nr:unnamed protein product [Ceratitis capitata]
MCVQWQSREVYLKSHKLNTCHWGLTHSSRAIFACGVAKEVKSSGYPPWHWYYNNEQEISSRHTSPGRLRNQKMEAVAFQKMTLYLIDLSW